MFSYFEVCKPFKIFLGKILPVQDEYNRGQTAALSISSSNPHISSLPLFQSYFNTPIHVQFADKYFFRANRYQFSLGSALIWSSLRCQVPSASL